MVTAVCKVNFVSEFNLFMRFARNNNLSARERMPVLHRE